jgi:hypothetical protein
MGLQFGWASRVSPAALVVAAYVIPAIVFLVSLPIPKHWLHQMLTMQWFVAYTLRALLFFLPLIGVILALLNLGARRKVSESAVALLLALPIAIFWYGAFPRLIHEFM